MRSARFLLMVGLVTLAGPARADIYQWEWVDPGDPSQGKQESSTLCPDGFGYDAEPYANLDYLDLTQAYLIAADLSYASFRESVLTDADLSGADLREAWLWYTTLTGAGLGGTNLTDVYFDYATLTDADLSGADCTDASFWRATLTGANLTDAEVRGASFVYGTNHGFTAAQLYSTASYKAGDLAGTGLAHNDLSGWNFAGRNLTGVTFGQATLTGADLSGADLTDAYFSYATLAGADFTGAEIRGARFCGTTATGFTAAQLYATASHQAGDLTGIELWENDLSGWDFAGQNLTDAWFDGATLAGAAFTDAEVRGAWFGGTDLSAAQLYATASYKAGDLTGIRLNANDLSGWNFAAKNLTDADFYNATLSGANFSDAEVRGAWFGGTDLTPAQLYATASYKAGDLAGIALDDNDLSAWNFVGQNLTNADFYNAILTGAGLGGANLTDANFAEATLTGADLTAANLTDAYFARATLTGADLTATNLTDANFADATLTNADLSGADARGAVYFFPPGDAVTTNMIQPDGCIHGLDLAGGRTLAVRDYHGDAAPLPIHVSDAMTMGADGTLRMVFGADDWGSEISFEPGIPVDLGGTLELAFASGVDVPAQAGRTLPLFDWSGVSPAGTFTVWTRYRWDLADLYTAGEATLLPPATLLWTGAVDNAWDLAETANWSNGGTPDAYYDCDHVTLNDTAGVGLIALADTVEPASVLVDNDAVDYALTGPGALAGPCGLTKRGGGTLTIATANAYTGGTRIDAGTLVAASDGALGEGIVKLGHTTGSDNAALLVDGPFTVDNAIAVQDDGSGTSTRTLGGTGTSGTAVFSGDVTLGKDLLLTAEPGGEVRFEGAIANADHHTLIKVGGGTVILDGFQTHGPGSLLEIQDGLLVLNSDASGTGLMDDAHLSILVAGGELDFGCDQHLDTLEIGDGGTVVFAGAGVVVVRHLVMNGLDLGGMTLTPEPATGALLLAGLALVAHRLHRRRG